MTPGARVQAAIDIIDSWAAGEEEIGRLLAGWGRANRYAGSGDRRAIGDLVHDVLRRLRSAGWVAGAAEPAGGRAALIGSLWLDGLDADAIAGLFSGSGHAPAPLTAEETARLGRALDAAPRAVRLDYPDWLEPHFAPLPEAALELLRRRAPLDLRVNLLKADREAALAALAEDGVEAAPGPLSPTCLRVAAGAPKLSTGRAYRDGLVEIQDAASQAVADYAGARPGETVLDFCAGGGGKTLALAAAMRGQGMLYAHDTAPARLAQLGPRAERAGVRARLLAPGEAGRLDGTCDLVLVDAPCSGSGAWRRNPDGKWRLTPDRLAGLIDSQDRVLAEAARALRPGGRLVYATCSLIRAENEERVAAFLVSNAGFSAGRSALKLTPLDGGDGFFTAEILRSNGGEA